MIFSNLNAQDAIFYIKNIFKIRKVVKYFNLLYEKYEDKKNYFTFTIDDIANDPFVRSIYNANKNFFVLCWHKSKLPNDWLDDNGDIFDYETLI